jgi:hypothetical protein
MQAASDATVLGDFNDASFVGAGLQARFYARDGGYFVALNEAAGAIAGATVEYRISHTFGVAPLQQYLIEAEAGRLQALSIAWDTRSAELGGQRWFHLYGDEVIGASDPLHWQGVYQNWNLMCADCHSTGVEKRFDSGSNSFATTFAAEDVACEACHGPGSAHAVAPTQSSLRLATVPRVWSRLPGQAIAGLSTESPGSDEIETCARCHSRRAQLADADVGAAFLDRYRLELLEPPLYHLDGQIRDEVFVYGSFLQSRMHAAGVTCSDCHDPHALAPLASGNQLCTRCTSRVAPITGRSTRRKMVRRSVMTSASRMPPSGSGRGPMPSPSAMSRRSNSKTSPSRGGATSEADSSRLATGRKGCPRLLRAIRSEGCLSRHVVPRHARSRE